MSAWCEVHCFLLFKHLISQRIKDSAYVQTVLIAKKHFLRSFHFMLPNRLFSILYTGSNHVYNSFCVKNNFIEWILIMNMMNFWNLFIFKSLYLDGLPHIIIITALIMIWWIGRIKKCRRMWAEIQSIKLRRHSIKICQKMSSVFFLLLLLMWQSQTINFHIHTVLVIIIIVISYAIRCVGNALFQIFNFTYSVCWFTLIQLSMWRWIHIE